MSGISTAHDRVDSEGGQEQTAINNASPVPVPFVGLSPRGAANPNNASPVQVPCAVLSPQAAANPNNASPAPVPFVGLSPRGAVSASATSPVSESSTRMRTISPQKGSRNVSPRGARSLTPQGQISITDVQDAARDSVPSLSMLLPRASQFGDALMRNERAVRDAVSPSSLLPLRALQLGDALMRNEQSLVSQTPNGEVVQHSTVTMAQIQNIGEGTVVRTSSMPLLQIAPHEVSTHMAPGSVKAEAQRIESVLQQTANALQQSAQQLELAHQRRMMQITQKVMEFQQQKP